MKIELTARADRTLQDLPNRLEPYGNAYTTRVVDTLERALILLGQRPGIGRRFGAADLRLWSVADLPYVIPYRIEPDENRIVILNFHFTRRPLPEDWTERE